MPLKEECAVVGIWNSKEAAKFCYLALYALQHRGQEGSGILSTDGEQFYRHVGIGKVADVFEKSILEKLPGNIAIGHNRYSTSGKALLKNLQPFQTEAKWGPIALAHNGHILNAPFLREELKKRGHLFHTTSDSEILLHLLALSSKGTFLEALIESLGKIQGAYSLVVLTLDGLYAIRDPWGFRPLVLGKKEDSYILASETCALDLLGAKYIRDILPGEILALTPKGETSYFPFGKKEKERFCIFELIYFARPDSYVFGEAVYNIRLSLGKELAKEAPAEADVVIPVPDSSNVAALGYSMESSIPFHWGLIRSHYVGRTFIEPKQKIRDFGAKIKYNPIKEVLKDKRVVVVDDSIVRGTTMKKIIGMLKKGGAKEVHLRISSSPIRYPCYYGIDIPTQEELIASKRSVEEIKEFIGADSLSYLSIEGMLRAIKRVSPHKRGFCIACFNGEYPIKPQKGYYAHIPSLFTEAKESLS